LIGEVQVYESKWICYNQGIASLLLQVAETFYLHIGKLRKYLMRVANNRQM